MGETNFAYWHKHRFGNGNFGDELTPYLLDRLTNKEFEYFNISLFDDSKLNSFFLLSKAFLKRKITILEYIKYFFYVIGPTPRVFMAVGSILQGCRVDNVIVWGSGTIASGEKLPNAKYLAVRGYKTVDELKAQDIKPPSIIGDPAILLPLVYKAQQVKKYKIGIIPHYAHYDTFHITGDENVVIINLLDSVENVIEQINSCDLTISTSLHGLIVSHIYRIKSIWAINTTKSLAGDNIKFSDYFSSIGMKTYNPLNLDKVREYDTMNLYNYIVDRYKEYLLPSISRISEIQKGLLSVFPFDLKL